MTTAPAATTEPAPTSTPGKMVAAAPIHTLVPILTGAAVMYASLVWFNGMTRSDEVLHSNQSAEQIYFSDIAVNYELPFG